jgi:LPXTG-site transpeptidase (sortase) family protein
VLFAPVENGTWQVGHLGQAVGHLEGTAPPGSDSNLVLAGHVTLDTGVYGPFARLGELAVGDILIIYEGDQKYFYLVESQRTINRNDVAVVYPSTTGQVTLITCTTWSSQEGRYINRLVVKGRLIK